MPIAVERHKPVADSAQNSAKLVLRFDQLCLRPLALALDPAFFGNVSKNQNGALEASALVLHRRAAIVNGNSGPTSSFQDRMICQSYDSPFADHARDRIFNRLARHLAEYAKDIIDALIDCLRGWPTSERLRHWIDECDTALHIGRQNGVANARENDLGELLLPLGAPPRLI